MYRYHSDILWTGTKFFSDKANEEDAAALDEFINRKAEEGWELVTYDYMATSSQLKGAFIITFRRNEP